MRAPVSQQYGSRKELVVCREWLSDADTGLPVVPSLIVGSTHTHTQLFHCCLPVHGERKKYTGKTVREKGGRGSKQFVLTIIITYYYKRTQYAVLTSACVGAHLRLLNP